MDRSDNSYTTTQMPTSLCKVNPSLQFDDANSLVNATELLPNWKNSVLDLCHDSETILIITEPLVLHDEQEIRCHERVIGLTIFVTLTNLEMQAFLDKFCQIIQISFVGGAVCHVSKDSSIQRKIIFAQNVQAISLENLENCSNFYARLGYYLKAPRLTRRNVTRVKCSDENGCIDLNLSEMSLQSQIVSCIDSI
ncbi:hypothetical protein Fcan01_15470 [Folsomia candida]|uniref:Uncharacterized protein n=1 Tax=Folsomia candida TaxID=158441 RepID=A0A226DV28_FOLCA|nr:hypothetical protein Fcan01_15470 [Folsomia candida]